MSESLSPERLSPRADRRRTAPGLAAVGLLLAVLAEVSSTGLLGLSGWFISACAVAGAAVFSSFSYLAPSGGVRAFAVARLAGNYSKNLVLHAAALRRVTMSRADLFARAAAVDRAQLATVWSGDLLDRSMADADSAGMALIRSTAPVAVAAVMTVGGVLAVGLAGSILPAAMLASGVAIAAAIAYLTPDGAGPAEQRTRKSLRAEVVTAVDAWAEMASLGAAEQLAERTNGRFRRLDAARNTVNNRVLRVALAVRLVSIATLAGVLACALSRAGDPTTYVFIALITAGVLTNAEQFPAAAKARATAADARQRLTIAAPADGPGGVTVPALRSQVTAGTIWIDSYLRPATAMRPERVVSASVPRGGMLVVSGRSGSGKSTLLRALAASLRSTLQPHDGRPAVTAVAADDYLFTGTLGSNFRLADPGMTDQDVDERLRELWLDRSGLEATTVVGPGGRELSGGEQRRVHLGRALATRPQVLIVDEPITGLDEQTAQHVLRTLAQLPDTTVVISLHAIPDGLLTASQLSTLPLD
jgi:ATP-binding cassette subfamily C protein CydC